MKRHIRRWCGLGAVLLLLFGFGTLRSNPSKPKGVPKLPPERTFSPLPEPQPVVSPPSPSPSSRRQEELAQIVRQILGGQHIPDDWAQPLTPDEMAYVADLLSPVQEVSDQEIEAEEVGHE